MSISAGFAAEPSSDSDLNDEDPEAEPVIAAYFYLFDDAYDAAMSVQEEIPWNKINRLYIAFATVDDGVLTDIATDDSSGDEAEQKIRAVVELCRNGNPDAEIFISSNYGDSMDEEYLEAAEDPQRFADSVVDYLDKYGLDGYDMDWETYQINDCSDDLQALLYACNAALEQAGPNPHGDPYKLSHTLWPGVHSPETVASLSDIVDDVNLMTYGPGPSYDLESYAQSYHDAGFPYEKMIAGVESEFGYADNGGVDTEDSIREKCAFVKENNLSGIFSWRLDNDMRTDDGQSGGGQPTFQVANWIYEAMIQ